MLVTKDELTARLDGLKGKNENTNGFLISFPCGECGGPTIEGLWIIQTDTKDWEDDEDLPEYIYSWFLGDIDEPELESDDVYDSADDCVNDLYNAFDLKAQDQIEILDDLSEEDAEIPIIPENAQEYSKEGLINFFNELEHQNAGCFSGRWIWIKNEPDMPIKICRICPVGAEPIYLWTSPVIEEFEDECEDCGEVHELEFSNAEECIENLLIGLEMEDVDEFLVDPLEVFDVFYVSKEERR